MTKLKSPQRLAKFLAYILERRPDEFGLVLDADGFTSIKELLKAVHEEEGWRWVRHSSINEILVTLTDPPIETMEKRIRARDRDRLPAHEPEESPPPHLYTCVRQRAHPAALEKGIRPAGAPHVILSSSREMALRIGKRSDANPVVLTVQTQKCAQRRVFFRRAGETLYLADAIPRGCFMAPPLPKEKAEAKKREAAAAPPPPRTPGSFLWDPSEKKTSRRRGKGEEPDRKKGKKKRKKSKNRKEAPPWRR
ncbi:MAG: hypothetical protein GY859_13430 [Desulfobacterales bacterium]|nr:hypothetical protein [Desulfobacterales bacterium]